MFRFRMLLPDMARLTTAAIAVLGLAFLASRTPLPGDPNGRIFAAMQLAEVSLACLIAIWPALHVTGCISPSEEKVLLDFVRTPGFFKRARKNSAEGQFALPGSGTPVDPEP